MRRTAASARTRVAGHTAGERRQQPTIPCNRCPLAAAGRTPQPARHPGAPGRGRHAPQRARPRRRMHGRGGCGSASRRRSPPQRPWAHARDNPQRRRSRAGCAWQRSATRKTWRTGDEEAREHSGQATQTAVLCFDSREPFTRWRACVGSPRAHTCEAAPPAQEAHLADLAVATTTQRTTKTLA